jgi:glycosyltransferase involved in cell wall biosynthesis
MRIVFFVSKFDPTRASPWLTDELCEAFENDENSIDVIFLDWNNAFQPNTVVNHKNTRTHIIAPAGTSLGKGVVAKILKWVFSSYYVHQYCKEKFAEETHDLLVSFSPAVTFAIPIFLLSSHFRFRLFILWDFFPYHQQQIGLIPFGWMAKWGGYIETKLLSKFNYIGCMTEKNVEYLKSHYELPPSVHAGVIPLWAKIRPKPIINRQQLRTQYHLPPDKTVAVFGGQIAAGRGVEDIVSMARMAKDREHPVHFLVIGMGPKLAWLKSEAAELEGFLSVIPQVPRDQYIELIASCDIGLVMTVPNVDIPSFPSKTLDYCCTGTPILAAVEKSTDYGRLITSGGFGRYCEAGSPENFYRLIQELSLDNGLREKMGSSARKYYEINFDVQKTMIRINEMVKEAYVSTD